MNHAVLKEGVALNLDFPFSRLSLYNAKRALIYFHFSFSTMNTNLAPKFKFLNDIKLCHFKGLLWQHFCLVLPHPYHCSLSRDISLHSVCFVSLQ